MSSFTGLYWKELKIAKVDFLTAMGFMLLVIIAAFSAAQYYEEPLIATVTFFFIYIMHIGYLLLFMLSSLRREGKTQLWLHNPNSSILLFSAKIAAGLTYYFISLLISFLGTYWAVEKVLIPSLSAEFAGHGLKELLLIALFITTMGIYYSIWVQFYWSLYHALKNIPSLKKFRGLIIFLLWSILTTAGNLFKSTPLYEKINETGVIHIHVLQEIRIEADRTAAEVFPSMGTIDISIVTVLLYLLITAIVFSISAWLLERKVEV